MDVASLRAYIDDIQDMLAEKLSEQRSCLERQLCVQDDGCDMFLRWTPDGRRLLRALHDQQ